jgi:hypothetical protein
MRPGIWRTTGTVREDSRREQPSGTDDPSPPHKPDHGSLGLPRQAEPAAPATDRTGRWSLRDVTEHENALHGNGAYRRICTYAVDLLRKASGVQNAISAVMRIPAS